MMVARQILITGANGRIGNILRRDWPKALRADLKPLWQTRGKPPIGGLSWDMLAQPYNGPTLPGGVVVNLAGVTPGAGRRLEDNADLALAACDAAVQAGAQHVFLASSAAVYGPGAGSDLAESAPLRPVNSYGQAKCLMEAAARDWHASLPGAAPGLTILRIGNVVGVDALIGGAVPGGAVVLDPVPGSAGGPVRSYIGPRSLSRVLARLCALAADAAALPDVVNIAAEPAVSMAELLDAAGLNWRWGPDNPAVVARVVLDTGRLQHLAPLPRRAGLAATMIDEWRSLSRGET